MFLFFFLEIGNFVNCFSLNYSCFTLCDAISLYVCSKKSVKRCSVFVFNYACFTLWDTFFIRLLQKDYHISILGNDLTLNFYFTVKV